MTNATAAAALRCELRSSSCWNSETETKTKTEIYPPPINAKLWIRVQNIEECVTDKDYQCHIHQSLYKYNFQKTFHHIFVQV